MVRGPKLILILMPHCKLIPRKPYFLKSYILALLFIPQCQQLNQFMLLVADEKVKLNRNSNIRMFLLSTEMTNGYWALNNFGISVWVMHQSSLKTILPLMVKISYTFLAEVDEIVLELQCKLYKITKIISR